ncbi:TPA: hypothetical protein ACSPLI_005979 [Pseudomonas aeruginosa]|uniref:hypothetical protein n=1 Tax=Pseudomonas aeruginosa TaxID=287 RepID=UPI00376F13BA
MLHLIKDVAENGLTTAPILVCPEGDKWVVWDGNRRVTSLKLLSNPKLCEDPIVRAKIESIKKKYNFTLRSVECLWTANKKALIEEVKKRHSGELSGVGQVDWSSYLRTLFLLGHDEVSEYKRAGQYLYWFEENGLDVDDGFPISTLSRFLKRENLLRLGFEVINDELVPVLSINTVKKIAARVIGDLQDKIVKVEHVWTEAAATKYIDGVLLACGVTENEYRNIDVDSNGGEAPTDEGKENDVKDDDSGSKGKPTSPPGRPAKPRSGSSNKLFGVKGHGLVIPNEERKVHDIVRELATLKHSGKDGTPISVAFLLRALVELSSDNYLKNNPGAIRKLELNTSLREKVRGAARDMYQKEILSKDRVEVMERHCNEEGGMLNINTLQRYLHSTAYFPNGETLNSMWNEFKDYVIACW